MTFKHHLILISFSCLTFSNRKDISRQLLNEVVNEFWKEPYKFKTEKIFLNNYIFAKTFPYLTRNQ